MTWRYNRRTDRFEGHDHPGVCGTGMARFVLDELEVGARAAMALDDPDQWWWELIGYPELDRLEREDRD